MVSRREDGGLARALLPAADDFVVGTGPGADVVLSLPGVEARHLRLVRAGGRLVAHDLGGGLRVNGRTASGVTVGHLDVLGLGAARVVILSGDAEAPETRRGIYAATLTPFGDGPPVVLAAGENLCGRASDAQVVLADPTASKRHARVTIGFDAVRVEDLGSANGTRVNGALVSHAQLAHGDLVCFGTTSFRLELQEGPREVTPLRRAPLSPPSLSAALLSAETTAFAPIAPAPDPEGK